MQFEVNTKFAELTDKSLAAVRRNSRKKAKAALNQLRDEIREHQEDLVIADNSPNSWLAVAKLRNRSELSDELCRWTRRSGGVGAMEGIRGSLASFKTMAKEAMSGPTEDRHRGDCQRSSSSTFRSRSGRGSVPTATKKTTSTGNAQISGRRYRSHGRRGQEVSRTRTRTRHSVQGEGREGAGATSRAPIQPRPPQPEASAQPPHPKQPLQLQQPPQHQRGQQQAHPGGDGMGSAGGEIRHFSEQVWRI
jgi:hypothetical protein